MTASRTFRLWPRSLYGQILLVAGSALLLAQCVNAAMLLSGARTRAVAEASVMVVSRVANQLERGERMSEGPAAPFIAMRDGAGKDRPNRRRNVTITVDDNALNIPRAEYQDDMSIRAQEFLQQGDIALSDVRISAVSLNALPPALRDPQIRRWQDGRFRQSARKMPSTAVLLTGRLPNGQWLHAAGLVRASDRASMIALLLQTFTLFVAVMVPLALVARRIARPLEDLTRRVRRVGVAEDPEPMERAGPDDVQQLIVAFNAMQARV